MIEFSRMILLIFKVAAFIALAYVAIILVGVFQKTNVVMNIAGSQSAMAHKLLTAPSITQADFAGATQKFVLRKDALDANNNSRIPGMDFDGSYYFLEIKSGQNMWRFNNTLFVYSNNALARGALPANETGVKFCATIYYRTPREDYAFDELNRYPAKGMPVDIVDGEKVMSGYAMSLVDPDSSYSYGAYNVKYPLCICDIACPADNGCRCAPECPTKTDIAKGENCG